MLWKPTSPANPPSHLSSSPSHTTTQTPTISQSGPQIKAYWKQQNMRQNTQGAYKRPHPWIPPHLSYPNTSLMDARHGLYQSWTCSAIYGPRSAKISINPNVYRILDISRLLQKQLPVFQNRTLLFLYPCAVAFLSEYDYFNHILYLLWWRI